MNLCCIWYGIVPVHADCSFCQPYFGFSVSMSALNFSFEQPLRKVEKNIESTRHSLKTIIIYKINFGTNCWGISSSTTFDKSSISSGLPSKQNFDFLPYLKKLTKLERRKIFLYSVINWFLELFIAPSVVLRVK